MADYLWWHDELFYLTEQSSDFHLLLTIFLVVQHFDNDDEVNKTVTS